MAKTARKPSTKKTKAKSAAKQPAVAAAAAKPKANKALTLEKLYKFNLFAAASNLIFAVVSVIFVSSQTVDFTWAYATQDTLAGSTLGPAYRTFMTVEIRYLLAAVFILSAIFSLLLATKLRKNYEASVKNAASGWRWLFSGITLALTLEIATLLAGIGDMMTLKLVAGLILTTSLLAFMSELANKGTKKQYRAFAISVFTGVIAWFPLAGSLLGTTLYGISNFEWYVYTFAVAVLAGFIGIGWSQYKHARDGVSAKGYLQLEGRYVSIDFLIKLAAFLIIISALHK